MAILTYHILNCLDPEPFGLWHFLVNRGESECTFTIMGFENLLIIVLLDIFEIS